MATTEHGAIEELRWENRVALDSLFTQIMKGPASDAERWIQCYPLSSLGTFALGGAALARSLRRVSFGNAESDTGASTTVSETATQGRRSHFLASAVKNLSSFGVRTLVTAITSQRAAAETLRNDGFSRKVVDDGPPPESGILEKEADAL